MVIAISNLERIFYPSYYTPDYGVAPRRAKYTIAQAAIAFAAYHVEVPGRIKRSQSPRFAHDISRFQSGVIMWLLWSANNFTKQLLDRVAGYDQIDDRVPEAHQRQNKTSDDCEGVRHLIRVDEGVKSVRRGGNLDMSIHIYMLKERKQISPTTYPCDEQRDKKENSRPGILPSRFVCI